MTPPPALHVAGARKTFAGRVAALNDLDLSIPAGSFVALLGPNGAGKTTLIRSIVGLTRPDAGRIEVFGIDVWRRGGAVARPLVGYAPQEIALDRFVPARELLSLHGRYFGMSRADAAGRADELLEIFDLTDRAADHAHQLSGGMRRRLLLARALVHRPALVILDEPTAGVDVELRHSLWRYVRRLHDGGTTILLTTHYLEEAEALCERVAFIAAGRIVADGAPADLIHRFGADDLEQVYLELAR